MSRYLPKFAIKHIWTYDLKYEACSTFIRNNEKTTSHTVTYAKRTASTDKTIIKLSDLIQTRVISQTPIKTNLSETTLPVLFSDKIAESIVNMCSLREPKC